MRLARWAGVSEVLRNCQTSMFLCNDVINLKGLDLKRIGQETIFAAVACPLLYQQLKALPHGLVTLLKRQSGF